MNHSSACALNGHDAAQSVCSCEPACSVTKITSINSRTSVGRDLAASAGRTHKRGREIRLVQLDTVVMEPFVTAITSVNIVRAQLSVAQTVRMTEASTTFTHQRPLVTHFTYDIIGLPSSTLRQMQYNTVAGSCFLRLRFTPDAPSGPDEVPST